MSSRSGKEDRRIGGRDSPSQRMKRYSAEADMQAKRTNPDSDGYMGQEQHKADVDRATKVNKIYERTLKRARE